MAAPDHLPRRPRGFTLMETLVMLIISALAVTLMMQALASFNQARERTAVLEGVRNNDAVALGWLGDSLRGLVSIQPLPGAQRVDPSKPLSAADASTGLQGTADGFSALTLTPLLGSAGVPVAIQWRVEGEVDGTPRLVYREPGQPPLILPLRDAGALAFSYLDADGKAHANWPPKLGLQVPMPQTIELTLGHGANLRVLARSPAASQAMLQTPYAPPEDE